MNKHYVFALISCGLVLAFALSAVVAFSLGVYFGGEPIILGDAVSVSQDNRPFIYTSTPMHASSGDIQLLAQLDAPAVRASFMEVVPLKFNPDFMKLAYVGEGDKIRLWSDSVAFTVDALYSGKEDVDVEILAQTSRGVKLKTIPEVYHTVPGEVQDILVSVAEKDVRNGDKITLTAKSLTQRKALTMKVDRSSDSYGDTLKSGLSGCGAASTYRKNILAN